MMLADNNFVMTLQNVTLLVKVSFKWVVQYKDNSKIRRTINTKTNRDSLIKRME